MFSSALRAVGAAADAQRRPGRRRSQRRCRLLPGFLPGGSSGRPRARARRWRWLKIRRDLREFSAWMTDCDPHVFRREFRDALFRAMLPNLLFRAAKKHAVRQRASRYPKWYTKAFVNRVLERQLT